MSWIFKSAAETFEQHRERWDELNRMQGNSILLDSHFVAPLVRHFASAKTLLGISHDSSFPGMVLLEKVRSAFWQTFNPSQGLLGFIVLGSRNDVADQMGELLRCLPGVAVSMSINQQDPDMSLFTSLDSHRNVQTLEWIRTARVTLTQAPEEFWKTRPSRTLIKKLGAQRRHLAAQGMQLEFVEVRDPARVAEGIREHGRLESAGWKGKQGTAIEVNNQQGLFYRELLEDFCRNGEGVMYRLLLDKKTIASRLSIERDGTMVALKTAYDESLHKLSPGSLLAQDLFRALLAQERIRVVEFYGKVTEWTVLWTDEIRTMFHLNFFRYPWIAAARRVLKARHEPH
ncbi:MAG: GNAT family N-acetyltransferase [Burkholderiales bacterium]